jgi:hypothetical protein
MDTHITVFFLTLCVHAIAFNKYDCNIYWGFHPQRVRVWSHGEEEEWKSTVSIFFLLGSTCSFPFLFYVKLLVLLPVLIEI